MRGHCRTYARIAQRGPLAYQPAGGGEEGGMDMEDFSSDQSAASQKQAYEGYESDCNARPFRDPESVTRTV